MCKFMFKINILNNEYFFIILCLVARTVNLIKKGLKGYLYLILHNLIVYKIICLISF